MTVKPIIFSAPMVRALLEGRKTQTRCPLYAIRRWRLDRVPKTVSLDRRYLPHKLPFSLNTDLTLSTWSKIAAGDLLWVRETWSAKMTGGWSISDARSHMYHEEILFRVDDDNAADGWWPSIHMPRWASRLTLEVTGVKVKRVQDISEADATAEGIEAQPHHPGRFITGNDAWSYPSAVAAYSALWDALNADRAPWASNPWVVAITFKVHRQNIDAFLKAEKREAA